MLCWFLLHDNKNQSRGKSSSSGARLPSPHTTALDHHRAGWASCVVWQLPAISQDMHTCQCYFLSSSNPHQPLLCPQVHSLLGLPVSINVFMLSYVKKLLLFSHCHV